MPRAPLSSHESASARTQRTGHDPVLAGFASSRVWHFPAICGSAGYLLELRCVAYAHAAAGGPWREAPAGAPWPPWGAAANTHPSTLAPAAAHQGVRTWEQEESPLRGGGCRNAGVEQILDGPSQPLELCLIPGSLGGLPFPRAPDLAPSRDALAFG